MNGPKAFIDLHRLEEDHRIRLIGEAAESGGRVGFFVEDDEKADRYVKKLVKRHKVSEVSRSPGPGNTVLVVVVGAVQTN